MRERLILSRRAFVEIVIWKLSKPLPESEHLFKYRLAYIANQTCVLRFDNEAGKGDHKHLDEIEAPYIFRDLEGRQRRVSGLGRPSRKARSPPTPY
jgi:hypothetical protein